MYQKQRTRLSKADILLLVEFQQFNLLGRLLSALQLSNGSAGNWHGRDWNFCKLNNSLELCYFGFLLKFKKKQEKARNYKPTTLNQALTWPKTGNRYPDQGIRSLRLQNPSYTGVREHRSGVSASVSAMLKTLCFHEEHEFGPSSISFQWFLQCCQFSHFHHKSCDNCCFSSSPSS